jgi:hypothetical protein
VVGDIYFDERTGAIGAYEIVHRSGPPTRAGGRSSPPDIADVMIVRDLSA